MTPRETVRQGYDAVAHAYLEHRAKDSEDIHLLGELESRLPDGARVLDLGCGAGVPIAQRLAHRFKVTGMDFSYAQIEMARTAVPNAAFIQADMIEADLGEACYEGVCSYYAIIHIPREHHRAILAKVHRALVPGGLALLCLGANDIEEDTTDDYHGEPMYWSHFDGETYLAMLQDVGFTIDQDWLVSDATCAGAEHLFVLVSKKASP